MVDLDNEPFCYTASEAKNTTVTGLRQFLVSSSRDRLELWKHAVDLRNQLKAAQARLATCEKVILDSVLSNTPPKP